MSGMDAGRRSRLPVHVLRHRDYRYLWAGQFVSVLGTQMHAVALSYQLYQLTGSVVQLGLLGLVRAAALMVTSLVGGVVADARDRRAVMLVTQSTLLMLSMSIAIATYLDAINVVMLYIVAALIAATSAFDGPARQALIPALVPRHELAAAMSLNILAMSTARMAGPAVGGFMVALVGVATTYVIDGASFLATIGALLIMRTRVELPEMRAAGLKAIAEGLRFIRATPVIWGIMVLDFLATLLGSTIGLAPVFADDVLDAGAQGLGLLYSAPAAGAVLGGLIVSLMPQVSRPGRVLVVSVAVYGVFLALFGMSGSLIVALLMLAGAGAADSVSVAMRHTVRNLATPDALRGRVAAAHSALAMGGPRLGEFQSGMTAYLVGPRFAMVLGGLAVIAVSGLMSWIVPAMLRYRFDEQDDLDAKAWGPGHARGDVTPQSGSAPTARAAESTLRR